MATQRYLHILQNFDFLLDILGPQNRLIDLNDVFNESYLRETTL